MKYFLTFSFLAIFQIGIAQIEHNIEFGVYQPLSSRSLDHFYNENWLLEKSTNHLRHNFNLGFDLRYTLLKNNYLFGINVAYANRKIIESNNYSYASGNDYFVDESVNYKQNHFGLFISVGYPIKIDKIRIIPFIEIPFYYYGVGKNDYYRNVYSIYKPNGELNTNFEIIHDIQISNGISTGVGLGFDITYHLNDRFYLGFSIKEYILMTLFNNPSKHHYEEKAISYDWEFSNGNVDYQEELSSDYEETDQFRNINFSNILPRFSIGFNFK